MPKLKTFLTPAAYKHKLRHAIHAGLKRFFPDYRGIVFAEPGHFYSPLHKVSEIREHDRILPNDGIDYWESIDLRGDAQKQLFQEISKIQDKIHFPSAKESGFNYYSDNSFFGAADAYLLAGMLDRIKPARIIEVGSGFSSGVMIDTNKRIGITPQFTFIDPCIERLTQVLKDEQLEAEVIEDGVQNCDLKLFDELEAGDFLFIDSSHVAKVGSDVVHIFLKVLPRIKKGVHIHIHDIFYPESYPIEWIKDGVAWNESLFLRCFLSGNIHYRISAFNNYAWKEFPNAIKDRNFDFTDHPGASFWMLKE
jgi:hypothetical protein